MYLDSAIIVKLLVAEPDSSIFAAATQDLPIASSELAFTEVAAALFKKQREKILSPAQRQRAWNTFLRWTDSKELVLFSLNSHTLRNSNRVLAISHPDVALRSMDAIHVSACEIAQEFPLCATDSRMRAAATKLGIPIFPEALPI
jgi:predicted nucleic acid-binding protein